jgi:hypothetical protein
MNVIMNLKDAVNRYFELSRLIDEGGLTIEDWEKACDEKAQLDIEYNISGIDHWRWEI